jgi:hypothetical protein
METMNNNTQLTVFSEPTVSLKYVWETNKLHKIKTIIETRTCIEVCQLINHVTINKNYILEKSTSKLVKLSNPHNMDTINITKFTKSDGEPYNVVTYIEIDIIDKL